MYEIKYEYRLHKKLIMITRIKKNISKRKTEWLGYMKKIIKRQTWVKG